MPESWGLLGVVLLGAGLAGFVQGLSGFAFALVALSVWAWALKPEVAAPLSVFGALLGQLTSLFSIRGGFEWRKIAPFVAGGVFGVPIGVFILHNVDPLRFRLSIGILLTVYGLYGLLSPKMPTLVFGGRGLDAAIGGVGGVLGGLGGLSGSIPAIWTQLRGWKRDLRRATMQVYNITMHSLTLTVYWKTGALNGSAWPLFAIAAPAMLVASYAGSRIYGRFSEQTFARVILILLLLSGAALVYGSVRAMAVT